MKLKKFYDIVVEEGINADPRGKIAVAETLKNSRKEYEALPSKDREYFDTQALTNPYSDTRILAGNPQAEVKTVMAGIDIDTCELLLAERLNAVKKEKIDLVVSHHPQGKAYAGFYEVMDMQADILYNQGVPINIAEKLVEGRKKEVARRIHAANHERGSDAAKLLGLAFLCIHTPADNHVVEFLQKSIDRKKPKLLKDILDLLNPIEEYRMSRANHAGPTLLFGSPSSRAGKIFIDMTGGTEGPKEILDDLQRAGVGTIIGMHVSEDHYKKLQDKNINVIIAGHIASDNLGMNLLLDKIEKISKIKIIPCSGFRRVKRS